MALQVPVDRGYLNLLGHLRQIDSSLSPETIQAAICHYLIHLPSTQPTPTPLTASIIASSLWHPLSLKSCLALGNTFRTATCLKYSELKKKRRSFSDASASSDLASWTRGILTGLNDGDALLRLVISGGLVLGMKGLHDAKISQRLFRVVEETMVLALAEVTDRTSISAQDQWASEFKQTNGNAPERMELSMLLAAQYFNLVSTEALSALTLLSLAPLCLAMIERGFMSGKFLRSVRESLLRDNAGALTISPQSDPDGDIDSLMASDSFTCVAFLCRLLARIIAILSNASMRPRKKRELWDLLNDIARRLSSISCQVEDDWYSSLLADVRSESQLETGIRRLTENLWTVLKTLLFSTLMLQQAILDAILFLPSSFPPLKTCDVSPVSHLTSVILKTLCSLSFVIASFGGVTAGATTDSSGPAFPELKKVFYVSIDILSTDAQESEVLVHSLIRNADACYDAESVASPMSPFVNAKRSFVLACIEQFVTVLGDSFIGEAVLPFCEPLLEDPSERQTYESAHSVILSIFAAHAEKSANVYFLRQSANDHKGKGVARGHVISLARRLVPGYAQSLLGNAKEGRLTTPQLRLAYSALVRSASTGNRPCSSRNLSTTSASRGMSAWLWVCRSSANANGEFMGDPALAWLCVEQLLQAIADSSQPGSSTNSETRLALSLSLISLISNVSVLLLPRVVEEVERLVDNEPDSARRQVLIDNVFEEVLEKVGDGEREIAMKWWFERSKEWGAPRVNGTYEQGS